MHTTPGPLPARPTTLVLAALAIVAGCFNDLPPPDGGGSGSETETTTGSTSTATTMSTSTSSSTSTSAGTSMGTTAGTGTTTGASTGTTTGASTGTTSTTGGTTDGGCAPGEMACGNLCIDTDFDRLHCGDCDMPCGTGETCIQGACANYGSVVEVEAGKDFTCVRTKSGTVRCWGHNAYGKLGVGLDPLENIGDDETPDTLPDVVVGESVLDLALGDNHVCALVTGGTVRCWGRNTRKQLGFDGADLDVPDPNREVEGVVDAVAIAAGANHTCALLGGGAIRCWGANGVGQLGYGNTSDALAVADIMVGGSVQAVALGTQHTCAILVGGDVRCWGANSFGQLGHGDGMNTVIGDDEVPSSGALVALGAKAQMISAGAYHTCVVLDDGVNVRCWGRAKDGKLGYGTNTFGENLGDDEAPSSAGDVPLSAGHPSIVDLACGAEHTCVVFSDGNMQCWGVNWEGQLGLGHTQHIGDNESPADAGYLDAPGIRLSDGYYHRCAITDSDSVRCWGRDAQGALGYGAPNANLGDSASEVPNALPDVPLFP